MLEPVQGEGGVIPADIEFLKALRALTRSKGNPLVEVSKVAPRRLILPCAATEDKIKIAIAIVIGAGHADGLGIVVHQIMTGIT